MTPELVLVDVALPTPEALVGPLLRVYPRVSVQVRLLGEGLPTEAGVGAPAQVEPLVLVEVGSRGEAHLALGALEHVAGLHVHSLLVVDEAVPRSKDLTAGLAREDIRVPVHGGHVGT